MNWHYYLFLLSSVSLYSETITLDPINVTAKVEEEHTSYSLDPQSTSTYVLTLSDLLSSEGLGVKTMKWEAEEGLRFRSLSQDSTLFLIDDIPMYKTVGGSVNTQFISLSTLEAVNINRGEGVSPQGLSPIGGIVSLSSRKPKHPLEAESSFSFETMGNAQGVYVGSRQENFYLTLNADLYNSSGFPLSDDFVPTTVQSSGKRLNSDQERQSFDFKIARTWSDGSELGLRVFSAESESGIAPYVYNDATTPFLHFTRIPNAANRGLYLSYDSPWMGNWQWKGRLYGDKHTDTLETYTDKTYSSLMFDPSTYKDYRYGGLILGDYRLSGATYFGIRALFEQNLHDHYDGSNPVRAFEADTLSVSATASTPITSSLQANIAVGYEQMKPTKTYQWNDPTKPEKDRLRDPLIGETWQISLHHTIDSMTFADYSVGSKVKMPSMSQMFPLMPWENSSPELREERSLSWDGAWERIFPKGILRIAGFWYDIDDRITYDNISGTYYNGKPSIIRGFEIVPTWNITPEHQIQLHYTYTDAEDTEGKKIDYSPQHRGMLTYDWKPSTLWNFTTLLNYSSSSYYFNAQPNEQKLSGYLTADMRVMYGDENMKYIVGIRNVNDEKYQSSWGYPQSGRTVYMTVSFGYETF